MREKFPRVLLRVSSRAEPLISQLESSEINLCLQHLGGGDGVAVVPFNGKKTKVIRRSSGEFSVIGLSSDPDRVKSKNLFQSELDIVLAAASVIASAAERSDKRTRRLIHNLKSITAKTMQEVFVVAQQHELIARSPSDQVAYISREIGGDSSTAASAFVEILKHQSAQKAEYSAFDALSGSPSSLLKEHHNVHKFLMNVFYLFFGDFVKNRVYARVDNTRATAFFDYDSVHACIYYIVENSAKYVKRGSQLNVSTEVDHASGMVLISFVMESTFIHPDEEIRVFEENYSGRLATSQGKNGGGLGLYLARQLARINNGDITLLCRRNSDTNLFSFNTFVLALPKS